MRKLSFAVLAAVIVAFGSVCSAGQVPVNAATQAARDALKAVDDNAKAVDEANKRP